MKGKKAMVVAYWMDIMLLIIFSFFIIVMIGIVFAGPVISEKSESSADLNRLNNHYNFNQFLKTKIVENEGKSVAMSIVEAVENEDSELRDKINRYAFASMDKCYEKVTQYVWNIRVFDKKYKDSFMITYREYTLELGGLSNCFVEPSNTHFIAVDLPTTNPKEPLIAVFAVCAVEKMQLC